MFSGLPLVVFSHLRWDFVFQRPQHLITRFGQHRPVYLIEEPIHSEGPAHWVTRQGAPGVTVCQPFTPEPTPGFVDAQQKHLAPLLAQLFAGTIGPRYDFWFYTPMALPLGQPYKPRVVVYDCMDELSMFANAPPQLLQREEQLLAGSDVVFTGGPSLYRAKRNRHANAHCFSSSVDAAHFSKQVPEPADQADIAHPRLGFFGVIDERLDVKMVGELAAARPEYQFVLVGPVVKIDPATLPRLANIHYLGQKQYADLPGYLGGWDVALLPFARNDSTKFISPTKTLEYMAAGKPIVSTPITDVAEPYGDIVGLGSTAAEFLAACDAAVAETATQKGERLAKYGRVLAKTSWDRTAESMMQLMDDAAEAKGVAPVLPTVELTETAPVVVIGAGPTGLSAAYHLGEKALLLEENDSVGGWCRSIVDRGFTFDYAGHIMFSNDAYVHKLYEMLLGDNVHWQDREAWVYSKDVFTRYPFQGALYGLPPEVIQECILGAVEARYGTAAKPGTPPVPLRSMTNGQASKAATACVAVPGADPKDAAVNDCCGDGVAESTVAAIVSEAGEGKKEPRNFEEFIYQVWGAGIAKHFAIPYNRKIWAVPLDQMETSWLGGRVPMPDLGEMILGALSPKPKPMGPNARFGYPLKGGFQALMDGFLPHLKGEVRLNTRIVAVSPSRRMLTLEDGSRVAYQQLVSTMALPELVKMMGDEVPLDIRRDAQKLRYTSVRCVNIGVGRAKLTDKHWIYYPEDTVFHRVFVQGNASPHCNPAGGFGLTCEITYGPLKPLPCEGQDLIDLCIRDCIRVGLLTAEDAVWASNEVDMPYAYVVYDHARPAIVARVREWLAGYDIHLAGRYSEWEYYNSDHAFLAGKKAADAVELRAKSPRPKALV